MTQLNRRNYVGDWCRTIPFLNVKACIKEITFLEPYLNNMASRGRGVRRAIGRDGDNGPGHASPASSSSMSHASASHATSVTSSLSSFDGPVSPRLSKKKRVFGDGCRSQSYDSGSSGNSHATSKMHPDTMRCLEAIREEMRDVMRKEMRQMIEEIEKKLIKMVREEIEKVFEPLLANDEARKALEASIIGFTSSTSSN